jgi:tRNA threonylcarbamoyladenosine biosynthesis protein TsaB
VQALASTGTAEITLASDGIDVVPGAILLALRGCADDARRGALCSPKLVIQMTTLLAVDTSTERMSLALVSPDGVHLHDGEGGAQASTHLIPQALRLFATADLALRDVDAFAFGAGPGAFTGLRVACSVVQGWAYALARPVLPIDSLKLVAEDARRQLGGEETAIDLWVAMDARMDEAYAGAYRWTVDGWQTLGPPALYALDALAARWRAEQPAIVAGSAVGVFGARLPTAGARTIAREHSRSAALAALAVEAWRRGEGVPAAEAHPLYLRDKVAFTVAERDAMRAQRATAP